MCSGHDESNNPELNSLHQVVRYDDFAGVVNLDSQTSLEPAICRTELTSSGGRASGLHERRPQARRDGRARSPCSSDVVWADVAEEHQVRFGHKRVISMAKVESFHRAEVSLSTRTQALLYVVASRSYTSFKLPKPTCFRRRDHRSCISRQRSGPSLVQSVCQVPGSVHCAVAKAMRG